MTSSRPPFDERALGELFAPYPLLHARCGRPIAEHPYPAIVGEACPFPALPPVEFVQHVEPAVRVVGIPNPGQLPEPVSAALIALAQACRDAYAMGVEVEGPGGRETALEALDTLRRYLA